MTLEQLDALIARMEIELSEYATQGDGVIAQMRAKIETEKQKSEQYINQLAQEMTAHAQSSREEYLRRDGKIQARKEQRAELAAEQDMLESIRMGANGKADELP